MLSSKLWFNRRRSEAIPKYDRYGNKIMTFEEIRDMLRTEPNNKKNLDKVERNIDRMDEMYPNEEVLNDPDGIFYNEDIWDKDYFYQKLAKRLGYSRVYRMDNSRIELL